MVEIKVYKSTEYKIHVLRDLSSQERTTILGIALLGITNTLSQLLAGNWLPICQQIPLSRQPRIIN